jgi:hypothetical protein
MKLPCVRCFFLNACQTALTDSWNLDENFNVRLFNLANVFILSGVRHYIGTFWEILDEPSRRFAVEFYQNMLSGHCVGEALRLARLGQITEYGEEKITWAGYLLYGDPTFNYMGQIRPIAERHEISEPKSKIAIETESRTGEKVLEVSERTIKKFRQRKIWITAAAAVIAIALMWTGGGFGTG